MPRRKHRHITDNKNWTNWLSSNYRVMNKPYKIKIPTEDLAFMQECYDQILAEDLLPIFDRYT